MSNMVGRGAVSPGALSLIAQPSPPAASWRSLQKCSIVEAALLSVS